MVRIPEKRASREPAPTLFEAINRLDPVGFLFFAPACIMILLALQWGGSKYPWDSSRIIGLFVGFVACIVAFIIWEIRRGATAMVPLSILTQRVVYSSCIVTGVQFGSAQVFSYYLPVWFQTILGVSPIKSGVYFMATAGPLISSTIVAGILGTYITDILFSLHWQRLLIFSSAAPKIGNVGILSLVGNTLSAIGGGLMSTFTPTTQAARWAGFQVLAGLGRGMTLQQPVNAVQHTLEPAQMAVGTSMVVFSQFFGAALVLALAETDFSASLRSSLTKYAPDVDAKLIFEVGAAKVRDAVTSEQLPEVLSAYNHSVLNTFVSHPTVHPNTQWALTTTSTWELACPCWHLSHLGAWLGKGPKTSRLNRPRLNEPAQIPQKPEVRKEKYRFYFYFILLSTSLATFPWPRKGRT
jgi:hypothetical protein